MEDMIIDFISGMIAGVGVLMLIQTLRGGK
jgi:hypothetical protein